MKKYLLLTAALTTGIFAADNTTAIAVKSDASASSAFNGFYAGALVGLVKKNAKSSFEANSSKINAHKAGRVNGFSYGIIGGYGKLIGSFYVGAEIGISADTSDNKDLRYEYSANNESSSIKVRYKRGPVFSMAPRLGFLFCNSYMAYVKPALEISKDKTTASDNDGDTINSKKKTKFVFSPSIGVEKAFCNNILARIEYNHNFGTSIKGTGHNVIHTLKYKSDSFKLGVVYKF